MCAVRNAARGAPSARQVFLADARVVFGAAAKGRLASRGLNGQSSKFIAYLLAFAFYPGLDFCPIRMNSADSTPRYVDVRPSHSTPPDW